MCRITPVEYAGAEGRPKQLLDAVKASLGVTPNMTTTMARSAVLEGWLGLSGALRKGSIDGATGERIALAVAEANECCYCLSAHAYLGANVAKLDRDELERARHFDSSDPKAAAILAFAEAVVHDPRRRQRRRHPGRSLRRPERRRARRRGRPRGAQRPDQLLQQGVRRRSRLPGRRAAPPRGGRRGGPSCRQEPPARLPGRASLPTRNETAMSTPPVILPPFDEQSARRKVQLAQDAWNSATPPVSRSPTPRTRNGATATSSFRAATPFARSWSASGRASWTTACTRSCGPTPATASRCASSTSRATRPASGGAATVTSTGSSTRPAA